MKIELYGNRDLSHVEKISIHADSVHIWEIHWRELKIFWEQNRGVLEKKEYQKAEQYRFYEDKIRYLAGKIVTKMLLKQYLNVEKIFLLNGKYGKPYCKVPQGKSEITFNISHSGEWILAIFAYQRAVGVDVQKMDEIPEYMELARNFFAADETSEIQATGNFELFYHYWAAKEAYLKALGIGLNREMKSFSVRGDKIRERLKIRSEWYLYPIPIRGYAACAAVQEKER